MCAWTGRCRQKKDLISGRDSTQCDDVGLDQNRSRVHQGTARSERNIVVDGGNFLGVVPYLNVPDPGCFKMIGEFASIGLGFGAALGVAKARPDKNTVLVVGDGGFLMTMGELETVVRDDLPIVIVLMNDCAYGAEQPVTKSVFPDVDFAPIAESFGFEAATTRTLEDLHKLAAKLQKTRRANLS
jgi:thiamine pyrophosphate-dependent acetolactate synthase large subunit-like protein